MTIRNKSKHNCYAMVTVCAMLIFFVFPIFAQGFNNFRVLAVGDNVYHDLAIQAVRNNYNLYKDSGTGLNAFDAYILTEAGADLATWAYDDTNLKSMIMSSIYNTLTNPDEKTTDWSGKEIYAKSSKTIAYQYLVAKSWGKDEDAEQLLDILQARQAEGENGCLDDNAFSDIPAFETMGRAGIIGEMDTTGAINCILANKNPETGAWTSFNDFMTTAQAVRALEYLREYAGDQAEEVQAAINGGLAWMKSVQQDEGSMKAGDWDDPVIDTAEAINTLQLLEIDPSTWISDSGKTPVDYLRDEALNDDGTFGTSKNSMDNTWVLDAFLGLGANTSPNVAIGVEITEENNSYSPVDGTQYVDFRATVYKLNGTISDIGAEAVWRTEDNGIADVRDSGMVTGIGVGQTVVSIEYQGISDSADVNINRVGLATQAVRNNYNLYKNSQAAFNAFDTYILTQIGANLEKWTYGETNLKSSVLSAAYDTINNPIEKTIDWSGNEVYAKSSKTIAYQYLAVKGWGEDEDAEQLLNILKDRQAEGENGCIDDNAFSDIPAFDTLGRAGVIDEMDTVGAINYILNNRNSETGAWTSYNDFITTSEAVRALEYLSEYAGDQAEAVQEAIDDGLVWMQSTQQDDGSLQGGDWDDPAIDTAEGINTLELLGIDPETWASASGKTLVGYLRDEALNDDGTFGTSKNLMDNTWVLDAFLGLDINTSENMVLGIEVNPTKADVSEGKTKQFGAEAFKLSGATVDATSTSQWGSKDSGIASVNNSGLVTGNASGETLVTATRYGVAGFVEINVTGNESGGNNGNDDSDEITVKVAVVGKEGGLLFGPDSIKLSEDDEYGWTALGALDATGLDWGFSEDDDGLVIEIYGQRNQGQNGWMYKVNSQVPTIYAEQAKVKNGDKIIWWYSFEAMSSGPNWSDLESGSSAGGTSDTTDEGVIKTTITGYKDDLAGLKENKFLNQDKKMTSQAVATLKDELNKNTVSLSLDVGQSESFLADEEVSLLIPEKALSQTAKITVVEVVSSNQPKQFAVKLGSSVYEFGPSDTKFSQPVTIAIKVPLTEDIDVNKLFPAWYNEETKTWVTIPAVIDLETGLVVFQINHFTKFAVLQFPEKKSFSDMGESMTWAKDAVEILAGKGFINGTGTGFEPKRSISRAEFVKIIVTALGLGPKSYAENLFGDVKKDDWFAGYVQSSYENKIITGGQGERFRPQDSISRNEVAAILYRLQETVPASSQNTSLTFKDAAEIPLWAVKGINYANHQGLMTGYADGTFKGSNSLTRAEAAVTVYRFLGFREK